METLFRLVLTRPPVAQDDDTPSIELSQDTEFQAALGQAQEGDDARMALKGVARAYAGSPAFAEKPSEVALHTELENFHVKLDALETQETINKNAINKAVNESFGMSAKTLAGNDEFIATLASLRDTLITIKLVPEFHSLPIEKLTNYLRDMEVISRYVADNAFFGDGSTLRRYRRRSLALPTAWELNSTLSTIQRQKKLAEDHAAEQAERRKIAEEKLESYRELKGAIEELSDLSPDFFNETDQEPGSGSLPPASVRRSQVFQDQIGRLQQLSQLDILRLERSFTSISESVVSQPQLATDEPDISSFVNTQKGLFLNGKSSFKPQSLLANAFMVKAAVANSLPQTTQNVLNAHGLNISTMPLDRIVNRLQSKMHALGLELDDLLGRPVEQSLKRIGNAMIMISTPLASVWNSMVVGGFSYVPDLLIDDRVPTSHGSVSPVGVADLLVVKQQLIHYEGTDVAHIENVLKGEKKEREHTRRRETEEFLFTETEITTSEERELESTNRFEMSRETSEVIREESSLKAGLTVSGKYGPTVEFSASAEGSISRSKETATKAASEFAQDVTERSANRITERVLERSSLRVTNEVIERNAHSLDNAGGGEHIAGVYQWVNKVYQAQMYNYGLRTMFDFIVPEPGAYLIKILQTVHSNATELEKPMKFTLRPDQITEYNYHDWVRRYGATDVNPPPEIYITKSIDYSAGGSDEQTDYNHSAQIQVNNGYKAVHASVGCVWNIWEDNASIDVIIGSRSHRFSNNSSWVWSVPLTGERDSVPFALNTLNVSDIAVAVEVKCARTDRAMMNWRHDTHAKLTLAYQARLAEYEEKLAQLELQAGVAIAGKNPALNMELMEDELKKHCITILTEQNFDLFDAISSGSFGTEHIDLFENEAEGPYVRFFEQAFEWEHMTWLTYPYFWGRKSKWRERISYEDIDPLFNQFLKAGYCRVVVPARLGFEGAIDHFLSFGEVWNGGPLPPISSDLYLPIADEIAERLDRPQDEITQGDPWLVRIPTTLVHLRSDDKLPRWQQNEDGDWVEVENNE